MTKTFRDRPGGHAFGEITHGHCFAVSQSGRKFVKRLTRREMRREHRRVTKQALDEYHQEMAFDYYWESLFDEDLSDFDQFDFEDEYDDYDLMLCDEDTTSHEHCFYCDAYGFYDYDY